MDWKPIETAPKDGTVFMAWGYYSPLLGAAPTADNLSWGVSTLRWSPMAFSKYEEVEGGLYRKVDYEDGHFGNPAGGYAAGIKATHWAPLPDGPREMPASRSGILGLVA